MVCELHAELQRYVAEADSGHSIQAGRFRKVTFALCGTCRKAVVSYETPSMLPGMPSEIVWIHFVLSGKHAAMPMPGVREAMCAVCRQPQMRDQHGWHCVNIHCPSRLDKE